MIRSAPNLNNAPRALRPRETHDQASFCGHWPNRPHAPPGDSANLRKGARQAPQVRGGGLLADVAADRVSGLEGEGTVRLVAAARLGDDVGEGELVREAVSDPLLDVDVRGRGVQLPQPAQAGGLEEDLERRQDAVRAAQTGDGGLVDGVVLQGPGGDVLLDVRLGEQTRRARSGRAGAGCWPACRWPGAAWGGGPGTRRPESPGS